MPELFIDQEAEPPRPDWLADDAVKGKPVSAAKTGKNTGKFRVRMEKPRSCLA
jgi:hypothetical protein